MTTLATLRSDIKAYMVRESWGDALLDSFVLQCEAGIRRRLRIRQMETTDTAFSVSARSTALPTRFIAMRSVSVDAVNKREIQYLPPHVLRQAPVFDDSGDEPRFYTIEGDNIVVAPVPTSGTLMLVYWAMFAGLENATDTNWLLTNAYDCYLYGSLRAAAIYDRNEPLVIGYGAEFDRIVSDLNKEHAWARVSGAPNVAIGTNWTP